jgi:SNF2 family DNA or RNA helicase
MKFTPHEYQERAIRRVEDQTHVGLLLDMGLGKTVITLTAVRDLIEDFAAFRVLVIAPKRVAEDTWTREHEKWDHLKDLRISRVLGSPKQRLAALDAPADIYVINRENVPWLVQSGRFDFDTVVIDELSSFKNPQAQRFKALRKVIPGADRVIGLTGTPAPNGLMDLWAEIYLLDRGQRLGKTISSYRDTFFQQDRTYPGQMYRTYSLRSGAENLIRAAIADICVSMKAEDYIELPDFIEDLVPVVLDPAARKSYDRLEREMLLQVDDQTVTAGTAAVLNGKLLQLCSGAVYDSNGGTMEVHDCKIEAFLEVIEQLHGEHALVFYWFQHGRDRLLQVLQKTGLRVRVYSGAEDETAWNAGEVDVLLAHPASCAYGLNLQQGGHHEIWFEYPNWALELYQQANARLYRQGQQLPVISHLLVVQDGMDEAVVSALHSKGDMQEALMQALKAKITKAKEGKKT